MAISFETACQSSLADAPSDFERLHSFLEQQFSRQFELLREVNDRVKLFQQRSQPASLPFTSCRTSVRSSVIHEDSVIHHGIDLQKSATEHIGVAESRTPREDTFDEGRREFENAGRSRKRDSARHSFVRRTLEAHKEKADHEASKLKFFRSRNVVAVPVARSWLATQIEKLVASRLFSNSIMLLILLNVVLLGVEVDVSTLLGQEEIPAWFGIVNTCIVMVFVLEVVLKCIAIGFAEYWCGHEACWNMFDAFIITVSVFETAIDAQWQFAQAFSSQCGFP